MTKVSEKLKKYQDTEKTIKYYKDIIAEWEAKEDDLRRDLGRKQKLICIKEALGDIDMEDEYLEIFLDTRRSFPKTPKDVKQVYDIISLADLSVRDASALVESYNELDKHSNLFSKIKKSIGEYDDFLTLLDEVSGLKRVHAVTDSYRIEFLKGAFERDYRAIYNLVREYGVRASSIMEVLPSEKFIEYSREKARELNNREHRSIIYKPATDLVLRRLEKGAAAEKYPGTGPDEHVYLGYTEYCYGNTIYTSFTKGEYEKDLKRALQKRKKKGDGYVGW